MVRYIRASAERLLAVVVGMVTAWLVGSAVGVHWWSMLPVIYVALIIARWRRFGDHGIQVPTMVLLSLLTVGGTSVDFTYLTIVETLAGGVIGVLINAIVLPPLHIREPRDQIISMATQVGELLAAIADGLRNGWDAEQARSWYETSTDIILRAPHVHSEIETGRESMRLNPRDNLLGIEVDWMGYSATVEGMRRTQWQVSGIARTLVDAVDDAEDLPAPSQGFLDAYADALDHIHEALNHFGLADDGERACVREELTSARAILDRLSDEVSGTSLDDSRAWPAYGSLLLDARRLARALEHQTDRAVIPTDSGPMPKPQPPTRLRLRVRTRRSVAAPAARRPDQ